MGLIYGLVSAAGSAETDVLYGSSIKENRRLIPVVHAYISHPLICRYFTTIQIDENQRIFFASGIGRRFLTTFFCVKHGVFRYDNRQSFVNKK